MQFPDTCRNTLVAFLLSVSGHLSRKRPADTFLDFLTNSSSIIIVYLNELASATAASPSTECAEAVQSYLTHKPDSNLAHVLDTKHQQKKLDLVAQDILECYLEHKSYNCEPVKVFCQQILSKLIMEMTINSCSRPEFINGWIVYLLEDGEPELLKDIDAGLEGITPEASSLQGQMDARVSEAEKDLQNAKETHHKRTISRAQEAMDDAMREAQRLSQLIAEDDARRQQEQHVSSEESTKTAEPSSPIVAKIAPSSSSVMTDDMSESTTQGIATPTSSQSDAHGEDEPKISVEPSTPSTHQDEEEERKRSEDPVPAVPFTSFDQLSPRPSISLDDQDSPRKVIPPLSLHNASISIFDDTDPNDRSSIRTKPTADYLIQIEPASSHYPGWMIVRKYGDFETIHEILRRIATISGAGVFAQAHATLPNFKVHTKASLREALERYLSDAIRFKSLAESEGMKRFLEKDRGLEKTPSGKGGFGWPTPTAFESMGKGMIDVLTKAPKDVAGGGKAFIGGVTGVLGNKKKQSVSGPSVSRTLTSTSPGPKIQSNISQTSLSRKSQDSLRNMSPIVDTQPALHAPMEPKPPIKADVEAEVKPQPSSSTNSRAASIRESMEVTPALGGDQMIQLPPPPSDIPDDYNPLATITSPSKNRTQPSDPEPPVRTSTSTTASSIDVSKSTKADTASAKAAKAKPPLTEQETTVAVELLFATIQELYTLSSAWSLRRTLLTAAKTFLLRPGNPQLSSIQALIQTTVLDANTSDTGIAQHLKKLRENALPTEAELKAWPAELNDKEKEELRIKARKLLCERGMPQALTSVMGQAASGEALGKVFDCLQIQSVARGLVFGLVLQGLRGITQ
jgi:hypothetical protein